MIRLFCLTLIFCVSQMSQGGEASQPKLEPVKEGEVAWYDCELSPVFPEQPVHLKIMTVDQHIERVYVRPFGICGIDWSNLKVTEGGKISGQLIIGHEPRRINRTLIPSLSSRMPLELNLAVNSGKLSGNYQGKWPKPKSLDTPIDVQGTITGTVQTQAELIKANQLPKEAVWPSTLGPNQNYSSGSSSQPIVSDLHDAKLLWVSEWIGPTESGSHRYGACVACPPCAGGASPLVWNGRVYQFRYEASGDEVQTAHLEKVMSGEHAEKHLAKMKAIGWTEKELNQRWSLYTDEQLVCMDAATGRTLWKVTWPQEGLNFFAHKCSLTNHTGVIANGKVFVFGGMGIVRCVDAETGKQQWSAKIPGYYETQQQLLAKSKATKIMRADTRSYCHGLNVIGNTLIAPRGTSSCGLVAFDVSSGKVLWQIEDRILGKAVTAMKWKHNNQEFIIAASANGNITCVDPGTGKIIWETTEAGDNEYQMLLVNDFLIGHKLKKDAREKAPQTPDDGPHSAPGKNYGQIACWKLSLDGAKQVWEAPDTWGAPSNSPIGSYANGLICFRGNFSYNLVKPETGERIASHHLTAPVRWDEGTMLALPKTFVLHPDTQHGNTKMFLLPANKDGKVSKMWMPPHPHATTYQSGMSHAWADGRLFIRGADALYCYDLRAKSVERASKK